MLENVIANPPNFLILCYDQEVEKTCFFCQSDKIRSQSLNRIYCLSCKSRYSNKQINKLRKIIEYFSLEIPANKASLALNSNYKTIHRLYQQIRKKILANNKRQLLYHLFDQFFIKDEERGRNTLVFALENKVFFGRYFRRSKFDKNSIRRLADERNCKIMVFQSEKSESFSGFKKEYGEKLNDFYLFSKRIFKKYQQVSKTNFNLYFQEAVFRYNHRKANLMNAILSLWQKVPN